MFILHQIVNRLSARLTLCAVCLCFNCLPPNLNFPCFLPPSTSSRDQMDCQIMINEQQSFDLILLSKAHKQKVFYSSLQNPLSLQLIQHFCKGMEKGEDLSAYINGSSKICFLDQFWFILSSWQSHTCHGDTFKRTSLHTGCKCNSGRYSANDIGKGYGGEGGQLTKCFLTQTLT